LCTVCRNRALVRTGKAREAASRVATTDAKCDAGGINLRRTATVDHDLVASATLWARDNKLLAAAENPGIAYSPKKGGTATS
jgi:hypothetical protein